MKKTLFYMSVFAAMATIAGCELKSEEYSQISSDLYPTTENDARDIVTSAAYSPFSADGYADRAFSASGGIFGLADIATDFGFCSWSADTWNPLQFAKFDGTECSGDCAAYNPRSKWSWCNQLSKMELSIDRVKGIAMDETKKARYVAELEVAQGFMGFLLWDWYGGLVIADLETLKNPQDAKPLARKSSEETFLYIKGKLTSAINSNALPATIAHGTPEYGRFTKGLAHMLLLKLYMQHRDWALAEQEGRELMKAEYGYALVTEGGTLGNAYANIFSKSNEGNKETIWASNMLSGYAANKWGATVYDWGGFKMSPHFYNTFESGDKRKAEALIYEDGTNVYKPLKYEDTKDCGEDCTIDRIIFRYADALTLLAEAIVKKGNAVTQEAIDLMNGVRTRAGLAAYTATELPDVATFMDKLLMERAHELWYESCRRQDLIRNDQYATVMKQKCMDYGENSAHIDALGESNMHLMPLPSSALNELRKVGITGQQNPGYGD